MSRSMWSFSGRHWLRSFAVWGIFGSGVALALDPRPEQQTAISFQPDAAEVLRSADPAAVAVILKLGRMDLTGLDVSDFGDHEAIASR